MGDQISEVDCIFFGFMVVIKYAPFTGENTLAKHPNILEYVERIKDEYYPDWDQLLKKN